MEATYDASVRAHYVRLLEEPVLWTVELSEGVMVDITDGGRVVGVEVLERGRALIPAEPDDTDW